MARAHSRAMQRQLRAISEEPIVFGRVIAQREYRVGRERLLLQVGTPHLASWKTDFYCPFRLVRGGKAVVNRTFGVDAFQALMLVFDGIKVLLERTSPEISWDGGEGPGDFGICRRLPTGLGRDFGRRVERLVDDAIARELTRQRKAKAARGRRSRCS